MSETTKYERIVKGVQNNGVLVIVLILAGVFIAIPKIREGVVTVYRIVRPLPPDPKEAFAPNKCEYHGEMISFNNILMTQRLDFVIINSTTYKSAIDGQYLWMSKAYPNHKHISQALVSMEYVNNAENAAKRRSEFTRLLCDVHTIVLKDGFEKRVVFDMSKWREEIQSPGHPIVKSDGDLIGEALNKYFANQAL